MKSLGELLYDLAALALGVIFAYFCFWGFVGLVGTSLLISLSLMAVERWLA